MTCKRLLILFLIINAIQKFQFQTVPPDTQCSAEEIASIVKENSDLLDAAIKKSSDVIDQQIQDAQNKIQQASESFQIPETLKELKKTLENLKHNNCTKQVQLQFDFKTAKTDALRLKCVANANKKKNSLTTKADAALTKAKFAKAKVALSLQKCSISKEPSDCSVVSTCCLAALTQFTTKIDSTTNKIEESVVKVVTEQNNCFAKTVKEALKTEEEVREGLLICQLQGFDDSTNELNDSADSNQSIPDNSVEEAVNEPSQPPNEEDNQQQQTEINNVEQNNAEPNTISKESPENGGDAGVDAEIPNQSSNSDKEQPQSEQQDGVQSTEN